MLQVDEEIKLAGNRSLATKRAGLVKRELELIGEGKKQNLEVLIGNHDDLLIDMTSQSIKSLVKGKYDLKVRSSMRVEEILELAENNAIDIFILTLNNLFYSNSTGDFSDDSLELIVKIKTTWGSPIITFSGYRSDDHSFVERVKKTADFFFPLPFKVDVFKEAFNKCLDMLPVHA